MTHIQRDPETGQFQKVGDDGEVQVKMVDYGDITQVWYQVERISLSGASSQVTQLDPLEGMLDNDEMAELLGFHRAHHLGLRSGDTADNLTSEMEWGFNIGSNTDALGNDNKIDDTTYSNGGYAGDRREKRTLDFNTMGTDGAGIISERDVHYRQWLGHGPVIDPEDNIYLRSNPNAGSAVGRDTYTLQTWWQTFELDEAFPEFGAPF